jgi:Ser/Thr protein kinase RdoA (MazF antagonist)
VIQTLRSLPDPQALRDHLADVYGIAFSTCTLIRSLVNDVYKVTAPDQTYVLKLYRADAHHADEIRWEAQLADHLGSAGLAVPRVVPLADGSEVGLLEAAEGARPYILSTFVEGTKPRPPFTAGLYRSFGELIATFHDATDSFRPAYARWRADADPTEPLAEVAPQLGSEDRELLERLASAVRAHFEEQQGHSRGICHGDVSLDNVLIGENGLTLHDFDLSSEGYRAADFTGVASTKHWDAFVDGYRSRRPTPAADLAAIPYLAVVGSIFNLRFHLKDKPLIRGTESISEGWADDELDSLRKAAVQLL